MDSSDSPLVQNLLNSDGQHSSWAFLSHIPVHVQAKVGLDKKLIVLLLQQPTLSDMTQYELNFSLLVEQMLSKIADPAYRQIIVEVIYRIH